MRLFLTILEGRTPGDAEPILASEDQRLISRVGAWLARKLHGQAESEDDPTACERDGDGENDGS